MADPVPIVRASDRPSCCSGSGDGMIDAAAAGLIVGDEAIRYSASMSGDELAAAIADADLVIVTDTNRRRAHHWRGSQDVTGYTEPASGDQTVWEDSGDARLDVFPDADATAYTVSMQDGPVSVRASSYGERFSYQPEARPGLAIDGDPNTAWTVLDPRRAVPRDHDDDRGRPRHAAAARRARRRPPARARYRWPSTAADHRRSCSTNARSSPGSASTSRRPAGRRRSASSLGRIVEGPDTARLVLVGIAELDAGLGQIPEWIVVPSDLTTAMRDGGIERPVTYVLTRERVRPTNRWRADPEWRIARRLDVPFTPEVDVAATVRIDLRASDAVLAELARHLRADRHRTTHRSSGGGRLGGGRR